MKTELERLYEMVGDLETAMLTTRRPDGNLVSRAMATQKHAPGADLWFVTMDDAPKLREIAGDPHVNLSYFKDRTREWISVSGLATLSRDRDKIRELYAPDWTIWFAEDGDPRHGTADDARLVLIGVEIHGASFLDVDKPRPVVLYELAKGFLTSDAAELGEVHRLGKT